MKIVQAEILKALGHEANGTNTRRRHRTPSAAKYIGWAESTLEKSRVTGGGPPYYKLGRSVIYDEVDLDAWMAAQRRTSTSDRGAV